MKPSEQRPSDVSRQRTEAVVARHVHELFKRLPMLSGFWLGADLKVTELSVFYWPGYTAGPDLHDQVTKSLVQLAEDCPEAAQVMGGRTFASAVQ
jgi:hypothetical protein